MSCTRAHRSPQQILSLTKMPPKSGLTKIMSFHVQTISVIAEVVSAPFFENIVNKRAFSDGSKILEKIQEKGKFEEKRTI